VDVQLDRHRPGSVAQGSQRRTAAALWGLLACGAAYLFFFEPGRTGFFPSCPFRTLTGFTCPGCGTTRALHQLLHGHPVAAFELNPLLAILLPLLAAILLVYTWTAFTGSSMPNLSLPRKYVWAFSAVVLVFWIFRNTPAYPFPS
jgi:Protein of unknown function (DUF2752)